MHGGQKADARPAGAGTRPVPFHHSGCLDSLVRRQFNGPPQPGPEGEGRTMIDMRMDFYDFGSIPEVEVPDPSEVFDATSLAREEAGLPSD